jgi:hypothetical protein
MATTRRASATGNPNAENVRFPVGPAFDRLGGGHHSEHPADDLTRPGISDATVASCKAK